MLRVKEMNEKIGKGDCLSGYNRFLCTGTVVVGQEEWSRGGICSLKGKERPQSGISSGVARCMRAVLGPLSPRSRGPGATG